MKQASIYTMDMSCLAAPLLREQARKDDETLGKCAVIQQEAHSTSGVRHQTSEGRDLISGSL